MKNRILYILLLSTWSNFGQTGINTQNPQAVFHLDGKKDNPATTKITSTAQQSNDFMITSEGWVGIGTDSPSTSVDITSAASGALKINDGTQGEGKILTSDANGVGVWKASSVTSVTGVTPQNFVLYSKADDKYMEGYIELPQGSWFVYLGVLVNNVSNGNDAFTSRLTLSSSEKVNETKGFSFINNNSTVLTQISNGDGNSAYEKYGMFSSGIIRVKVETASLKLYLWNSKSATYMRLVLADNMYLDYNSENYLFAIKAN